MKTQTSRWSVALRGLGTCRQGRPAGEELEGVTGRGVRSGHHISHTLSSETAFVPSEFPGGDCYLGLTLPGVEGPLKDTRLALTGPGHSSLGLEAMVPVPVDHVSVPTSRALWSQTPWAVVSGPLAHGLSHYSLWS